MNQEQKLKIVVYVVLASIILYVIYTMIKDPVGDNRVRGTNDIPDLYFSNLTIAPIVVKYTSSDKVIFSDIVGPGAKISLGPNVCFQSGPCGKEFNDAQISLSRYGCNEDGKIIVYVDQTLRALDATIDKTNPCKLNIMVVST